LTPAGYRIVTIDGGKLSSYHRTSIDAPIVTIASPAKGACARAGQSIVVSAELDAGDREVTARVDCATPIALAPAGGWAWTGSLPDRARGRPSLVVEVSTRSGGYARRTRTFEVCAPPPVPPAGADWPQLGGDPGHTGHRTTELAPPVVPMWTTAIGGHVLQAP